MASKSRNAMHTWFSSTSSYNSESLQHGSIPVSWLPRPLSMKSIAGESLTSTSACFGSLSELEAPSKSDKFLSSKSSDCSNFNTLLPDNLSILYHSLLPSLHRESKKGDTIHLSISLLNIDRFSQFFHRRSQLEMYNKIINKDPTSPQMCCYATLWNVKKTEKLAIIWIKYLV